MGLKYRAEYTSVNNIEYKVEVSNADYSGSVIEITGNAVYGLNSVEDLMYPIRSKFLKLSLLATPDEPLEDLFATNEREWKVEFYKDDVKIFFGYLSSEGATQSFITEERFVDFDVLDPLAFLQDLAYVQSDGSKYTGNRQVVQTIASALKRGFEDENDAFNIVSYINIDYRIVDYNLSAFETFETGRFPKDVTIPQSNFVDVDSNESVSCQNVLIDLLGDLKLTITQINGSTWVIGHALYDNPTMDAMYINSFDSDGSDISDISLSVYNNIGIVQDAIGTDGLVKHANENQSYYYKRALQKISVDYEFIYKPELTNNSGFDNGVTGVSMPEWSVGNGGYSTPTDSGYVEITRSPNLTDDTLITIQSDTGLIGNEEDRITVKGSFKPINGDASLRFNIRATSVVNGDTFYLRFPGTDFVYWDLTPNPSDFIQIEGVQDETTEFDYSIRILPGLVEMDVVVAPVNSSTTVGTEIELYDLGIYGVTLERLGNTQTTVEDDGKSLKAEKKSINYDTSESGTKSNHLFKFSTGEPISGLKNNFIAYSGSNARYENKIGHDFGVQEIRQKRRRIIFNGDFFNFFEPSDVITISDISSNKFIPIEYSFDTQQNLGSAKFEERNNAIIETTTTNSIIYGRTIEPTIE